MIKLLDGMANVSFEELSVNYQECLRDGAYDLKYIFMGQEDLKSILEGLSKEQIERLKKEYETLDKNVLYLSILHGPDHIERTIFWTFLLSEKYLSSDIDKRIVLDAAKYHDIGRRNDFEDREHGMLSAKKVCSLLNNPIYEEEENRNLLCAIIELHSLSDEEEKKMIQRYHLTNLGSFIRMWKILKDADGLDRIRLSQGLTKISALNPAYLRLEQSLHFIKASHQLCTYYRQFELEEKKRVFIS